MISDVPRDTAARLAPAFDGAPATVEIAQRAVDLPPGQTAARDLRVYLGPKESRYLDGAGGHLDQAVQKGWFPPLTNFARITIGTMEDMQKAVPLMLPLLAAPPRTLAPPSAPRGGEDPFLTDGGC